MFVTNCFAFFRKVFMFLELARPAGFEPATFVYRSNALPTELQTLIN